MTGSKDFTCIIWSLQNASVKVPFATTTSSYQSPSTLGGSTTYHQHSIHSQMNANSTLFSNIPKPIHRLYGHDNELSCVAIMTELDLVVSGSKVSKEVYLINLFTMCFEYKLYYFIWILRMVPSTCIRLKMDNMFAQFILLGAQV